MSVCVLVKVGEGLVLAADSASSIAGAPILPGGQPGPQGIIKLFFNATKIFQIGKLPLGILTWGAGSFQARNIASLVHEFENTKDISKLKKEDLIVQDVADELFKFMSKKSDEFFKDIPIPGRPKAGLILCGYSKDKFFPEEYIMTIPDLEPKRVRPDKGDKPDFGANWFGMIDAMHRFHHGYDNRLFDILKSNGISEADIEKIKNQIAREIEYQVIFNAMPLGDAIDYAKFAVEMTIARFRFAIGAELCGGDVDVATITKKDGFEWIQKKVFCNKKGQNSNE
jgi:hypothetical protein